MQSTMARYWNAADVALWLDSVGFSTYEATFRSHGVDGRRLMALSSRDLQDNLGISAWADCEALGELISELRSGGYTQDVQQRPVAFHNEVAHVFPGSPTSSTAQLINVIEQENQVGYCLIGFAQLWSAFWDSRTLR